MRMDLLVVDGNYFAHKISTWLCYLGGSGLFAGSVMDYLGDNAAAFGVIIMALTYVTNFVFQFKRDRRDKG